LHCAVIVEAECVTIDSYLSEEREREETYHLVGVKDDIELLTEIKQCIQFLKFPIKASVDVPKLFDHHRFLDGGSRQVEKGNDQLVIALCEFLTSQSLAKAQETNHTPLRQNRYKQFLTSFPEKDNPGLRGTPLVRRTDAPEGAIDLHNASHCFRVKTLCIQDFEQTWLPFEQHHPLRDEHLAHDGKEDGPKNELKINRGVYDIAEFKQGQEI